MEFRQALQQFVQQNILKNRSGISLNENTPLLTSGIVDSLGIVSLVTFIEDEFSIKVPLQDVTIENFQSIELIDNYLQLQA